MTSHQGYEAIHHSSIKTLSRCFPKTGRIRFRVHFFVTFLGKQKSKAIKPGKIQKHVLNLINIIGFKKPFFISMENKTFAALNRYRYTL